LRDGGGYAEFAVATEEETSLKPKALTFEQSAAVPLVAMTAWQALIDTAKLSAGQDGAHSRRVGRCWKHGYSIARRTARKVLATCFDGEPGPAQTTRRRRVRSITKNEVRRGGEGLSM
jgi:hypothetical protein